MLFPIFFQSLHPQYHLPPGVLEKLMPSARQNYLHLISSSGSHERVSYGFRKEVPTLYIARNILGGRCFLVFQPAAPLVIPLLAPPTWRLPIMLRILHTYRCCSAHHLWSRVQIWSSHGSKEVLWWDSFGERLPRSKWVYIQYGFALCHLWGRRTCQTCFTDMETKAAAVGSVWTQLISKWYKQVLGIHLFPLQRELTLPTCCLKFLSRQVLQLLSSKDSHRGLH